jgi:hypothetical protein
LLYHTTYVTRVPPFIEFNLEAVYLPKEIKGNLKFIPVIIPDALSDLSVQLSLYSKNGNKLIAQEKITRFEKVKQFTDCFEKIDISSLPSGNYSIDCELFDKNNQLTGKFEQLFTRDAYEKERNFGARKGEWNFGGVTGEAVIVEFPDQKDFVLWEPANYVGMWFLNNVGLTYEWVECWGFSSGSCNEPIQDKKNLYGKTEIIENSPARVIVRWTYALNSNNYTVFFNEWVEEYFTFFPDGTGIRRIEVWANTDLIHEIIQPQYIFPNGVLPGQMVENVITRVFNLKGDSVENLLGSTGSVTGYSKDWSEEILRMTLKNRQDPFMIVGKSLDLMPGLRQSNLLFESAVSRDIRYNLGAHWPITKLEVDIYNIVSTELPFHSWIGSLKVQTNNMLTPNVWTHLFGVTDKNDEYIKDIAASWLHPARVNELKGNYMYVNFNAEKNAYEFLSTSPNKSEVEFTLTSTLRKKVIHPFIILQDYKGKDMVELYLDGKKLTNDEYKYGLVQKDNLRSLNVWLNKEIISKARIRIK